MTSNEFEDLAEQSEDARRAAQSREDSIRKAAEKVERAKQIEEGRCNIVPMPNVATRPFRSELYTESMPLFVANSFKEESRSYERKLKHPETGEPIIDRVVVGKTGKKDRERGVLKQEHQEAWYKLLKLWDEQGYSLKTEKATVGVLKVTQYELVMALVGDDSAKAYARVGRLLADLAGIPILRSQHYSWQNKTDKVGFTLVDGATWIAENVDAETMRPFPGGRADVTVSFSPFVTEQFLRKHVKQVMLTPYLELSGVRARDLEEGGSKERSSRAGRRAALAPLLYSKLDYELARKDRYHIKLAPLFAELGMTAYRYKSQRKQRALFAVKALNGKPIAGEKYKLRVTIRESSDGKDFVLEAERTAPQMDLPGLSS